MIKMREEMALQDLHNLTPHYDAECTVELGIMLAIEIQQ